NKPLLDEKQLGDYVNQLFSHEKFSVVAYEKVIPAFARLDKQLQESLTDLYKIPADWFASISKRLVPGIATRNGLTCSKEKTIEFLCEPEFNFSETTLLRMFHIKNPMDLFMNANRIDIDEKQGFQINPFVSLDLSDPKIDAVACKITKEQLKIQICTENDKIKVSNQFKNDIEKALESINPYSKLSKVFDKYGHFFCKNYILGNSLESMCYSYSEFLTEIFINFQRSKVPKDLGNLIKEWKDFQSKFEVNAFSDDYSVVNPERVEKWLNENNSTEIIKKEERVLMTGEEIIGNEIKYHRIKFGTPLRSNKYQIIGSIVTIDYKKTNLTVKFRLMDCCGFFAIIEECKNSNEAINSKLKICWALIGEPLNLDHFNRKLSNNKLVSGSKKIKMNQKSVSDTVNIPKQISKTLVFATIFEFQSTNFEPTIEVIINSSSSQQINYTLINHKFEDIDPLLKDKQVSVPFEYNLNWYIIDISEYEKLFSWTSVGHEIIEFDEASVINLISNTSNPESLYDNESEIQWYSEIKDADHNKIDDIDYNSFEDTNYNEVEDIEDTSYNTNEIHSITESLRINKIQHTIFSMEYPPISSKGIAIFII
ncbi:3299_t:CDS:2, partial [Gigaspora rosea]